MELSWSDSSPFKRLDILNAQKLRADAIVLGRKGMALPPDQPLFDLTKDIEKLISETTIDAIDRMKLFRQLQQNNRKLISNAKRQLAAYPNLHSDDDLYPISIPSYPAPHYYLKLASSSRPALENFNTNRQQSSQTLEQIDGQQQDQNDINVPVFDMRLDKEETNLELSHVESEPSYKVLIATNSKSSDANSAKYLFSVRDNIDDTSITMKFSNVVSVPDFSQDVDRHDLVTNKSARDEISHVLSEMILVIESLNSNANNSVGGIDASHDQVSPSDDLYKRLLYSLDNFALDDLGEKTVITDRRAINSIQEDVAMKSIGQALLSLVDRNNEKDLDSSAIPVGRSSSAHQSIAHHVEEQIESDIAYYKDRGADISIQEGKQYSTAFGLVFLSGRHLDVDSISVDLEQRQFKRGWQGSSARRRIPSSTMRNLQHLGAFTVDQNANICPSDPAKPTVTINDVVNPESNKLKIGQLENLSAVLDDAVATGTRIILHEVRMQQQQLYLQDHTQRGARSAEALKFYDSKQ